MTIHVIAFVLVRCALFNKKPRLLKSKNGVKKQDYR